VNALLGRGEKLLFTGKEVFPLSPNPTPLFKKSGILCSVSIVVFGVKKCNDEITVLTSSSIKVNECAVDKENFLFTGKESFPFPPRPLSLSKKSGVLGFNSTRCLSLFSSFHLRNHPGLTAII